MRITILSRHFPPAVSGIGDHTDMLASELARRGVVVSVVTSPGAEERSDVDVHGVVARWDGAGIVAIADAVAATKPDVVLWQYNPFSIGRRGVAPRAGALARMLARDAQLVVWFHELWFPWGRNGARGLVWAIAQRAQARGVLRAAHRWIVTTESREEELRMKSGGRVVRIPVGTSIEPVREQGDARARLGIPHGSFLVAHFGSVGPGRDLGPAFDAFRRLRERGIDARLLLIGATGPFTPPADLAGAIHTTGPASRAEVSAALRAADVYLHADHAGPSVGRRTTIVAALAHGLPLVSYEGPDRASELSNGRDCLLVAADGDALARALAGLASDRGRALAIGDEGRRTYEEYFSWSRIGDAVLRVCTGRR